MSAHTRNPSTREVALCELEKALMGDKIINKCREVILIKAQRGVSWCGGKGEGQWGFLAAIS